MTTKLNGILLPCPCCQDLDARVAMDLADTSASDAFRCYECDCTFSRAGVEAIVSRWVPFLRRLDDMLAACANLE